MVVMPVWRHGLCLILDAAAIASQFLEGDKYVTSSLVIPMVYGLMATSSPHNDVKLKNRAEDEFNDALLNPVSSGSGHGVSNPHTRVKPHVQIPKKKHHF